MLGPVGSLVGAAIDISTAAATTQQKLNRSKEFTELALAKNKSPSEMNELVVSKLKNQLQEKGYKVITTRVPLEQEQDVSELLSLSEKIEGYSTLAIRTTAGYYAEGLTKLYNPEFVVRYVLSDASVQLLDGREERKNTEISYKSHEEVMADFDKALATLKTDLQLIGTVIYQQVFDFSGIPSNSPKK